MKSTQSYTTTSRTKIMEYLQENTNRTVNVHDISVYLKEQNSEVNKTTIYRYLEKLAQEGSILKYPAPKGEMASFQYIRKGHECDKHLHLKCKKCGGIIHLECDFMDEILKHIYEKHGFELQCDKSILYGVCEKCRS